jgi:hypothetical protein
MYFALSGLFSFSDSVCDILLQFVVAVEMHSTLPDRLLVIV